MYITLYITKVLNTADYALLDELMKGFDSHRNCVFRDIDGTELNYQLFYSGNNTLIYANQYRNLQARIVGALKQYFPLTSATMMHGNGQLGEAGCSIDNIPPIHLYAPSSSCEN